MCDIKDLIYKVSHDYGLRKMAAHLGRSYNVVKNKVDPNCVSHHTYAHEIDLIAAAADTNAFAEYFADQRGLMCVSKPDFEGVSDQAILELFLKLQKEQGDWSEKISDALSDGGVTWDELITIRKEYNDFTAVAAEIMSRLEVYMAATEERESRGRSKK